MNTLWRLHNVIVKSRNNMKGALKYRKKWQSYRVMKTIVKTKTMIK